MTNQEFLKLVTELWYQIPAQNEAYKYCARIFLETIELALKDKPEEEQKPCQA